MAIITRLFMLLLGYVLACIAASLVLTIGAVGQQWNEFATLGLPAAALWPAVGIGALIIAIVAILPALLVIVLAEGFVLRSAVFYGAMGAILALALAYGIDFVGYVGGPDSILVRERELFAAAGIAGGLVYWIFAGRKAGAWKS